MKTHKPYPAEFRTEALRLVREHGMRPSQVAADLGVDRKTLQRWLHDAAPPPPASQTVAPTVELMRLRRENAQLRMERDILKKAISIFSQMPQ